MLWRAIFAERIENAVCGGGRRRKENGVSFRGIGSEGSQGNTARNGWNDRLGQIVESLKELYFIL